MRIAGLICAFIGHKDVVTEIIGDVFRRGDFVTAYFVDDHHRCQRCGRAYVQPGAKFPWGGKK